MPRRHWRIASLAAVAAAAAIASSAGDSSGASGARQVGGDAGGSTAAIVHYRRQTTGSPALTVEAWQSIEHPERLRTRTTTQSATVEQQGGDLYDAGRNTIYRYRAPSLRVTIRRVREAIARKIAAARRSGAPATVIGQLRADRDRAIEKLRAGAADDAAPDEAGDPLVAQFEAQYADGGTVADGVEHDGMPARVKTALPQPRDGVRWTLWTAAADDRPLELAIDHGDGTPVVERTTWPVYEVLSEGGADQLTLEGAHPDAVVTTSQAAYREAARRLHAEG